MTERGGGASLAEMTAGPSSTSTVHRVQVVLLRLRRGDGGELLPQLQLQGQL